MPVVMVLLRERTVERAIRRHLKDIGFDVEPREKPTGVDIRAHRSGHIWFVEVEGNARKNGAPLKSPSARYTHFYRCVGQICRRIGEGDQKSRYAVGLPVDERYQEYVKTVKRAFRLLGVKVIWVSANSEVRMS